MPIRMALYGVICLTALTFAGPVVAAENGPYPVWWSAELELDSLDQIEARLRRALSLDYSGGFLLLKGAPGNYETVAARSCESLLRLTDEGHSAITTNDLHAQNLLLSECQAIAMLGRAKPARVSHLRDFVMSAGAPDYLPPLVNLYPSCAFICYAVEANERGIPFARFDEIERVEVRSPDSLVVWTVAWRTEMTILARGDFTADGLDDMLLMSNSHATEGSLGAANLFILTRANPDEVLRAIGAGDELCSGYECHPLPSDINKP
jgi:hypothetical protein